MNNNQSDVFFKLLEYCEVEGITHLTEDDVIKELEYLNKNAPENLNAMTHDLVDYERLIMFEVLFSDNENIKNLLWDIKTKISHNYILRKKLIARLCLPLR